MPDQTPTHQITYPLGTDRADIRTLETLARDVDRELGELDSINTAEQAKLVAPVAASWTPVFSGGWVIGNGVVTAEYYELSGFVSVRMIIKPALVPTTVWGSGFPTFTLPSPAFSAGTALLGFATKAAKNILMVTFSANSSVAVVSAGSTGGSAGTGIAQFPVATSVGSPWAEGSVLHGSFVYRRV